MDIAVIGGADGPTAIFVGSRPGWAYLVGLAAVILFAVILAILIRKKRKKNS